MTRLRTKIVIAAAIAVLMLSLLDTSIVTTAVPAIARDFGPSALAHAPWLLVAYALAETVTQPLYGKLTDRHGPKPVLLASLAIFGVGSVLCAVATSMTELIGLRVFQGLGAAGLLSVTFVLIGHLRAGTEHDDSAGNAAAGVMLALGLILGPLVGGSLVEHVTWRWIFWINVPITTAVLAVMWLCLRLRTERQPAAIDWPAAALLATAAGAGQLLCLWIGGTPARPAWQMLCVGALGVGCLAGFLTRQRTSAHPFFAPALLRNRTLRGLAWLQLATGIGLAASIVYVTLELQVLHHYSPIQAGLQTIPMAIGVLAGSLLGVLQLRRHRSLRQSFVAANALCAVAFAVLAATTSTAPIPVLWVALFTLGLGIGLSLGNELLVVQGSVPLGELGVAITGIRFVETLGTSAGAASFAVLFAHIVQRYSDTQALTVALSTIFVLGAAVLSMATWMAHRLPADLPTQPHPGPVPVTTITPSQGGTTCAT